ncbi:hypothetical protein [Mycoplana dimorpha]|uniref:Chromosome segregation ATPase n=1 Tax=Mycoplana dimorpha TaxID=28320 RepID=A0A2T5B698_MYCDI|nr:hypothetical protein [Mycoplana dimorpha]PTM94453.1 hypothetical protein C7449_105356 [Mycoplana dimorpha]
MIEYALLFALGFLAATLAGLLVAPAIQRRIVAYTENRLKATMPLSPQEVRAQTDMARAAFAAENARISQKLVREREKSTQLAVKNEALKRDVSRLAADNADLKAEIEDMNVGAGDLRSTLRHEGDRFAQLKAQLEAAEREVLQKKREIEALNANRELLQSELNDGMIALAASETEVENLKSRLLALRHEREKLLDGLRAAQGNLKETTLKLSREEGRARQLEAKLSREISNSAAKDATLERRAAEIGRLRDKLKGIPVNARTPARPSRPTEARPLLAALPEAPRIEFTNGNGAQPMTSANGMDIPALEADVRDRGAAVAQRLSQPASPQADAELREEIADLAARMIVVTDAREGAASPIRSLLDQAGAGTDPNRISLAQRAKNLLPPQE